MHEIIERIGWVLVHSLWQFGLIAVLTGIVMRAMRRRSADARYAVLVAAMAVLIGFPVVTAFLLPRSASESSTRLERSQTSNSVDELGSPGGVIADGIPNAAVPVIINESAIDSPASTPPVAVADLTAANPIRSELSPSRLEQISALLRPWFTWIVAGWSLGVVLCSFRPLLGWQMLRRLKRYGISPVPHSIQAALNRVSVQMGMHQSVEVLLSSLAQVPIVVGYFKPAILLPISFVTHIPPAQVEAILAHELAHVGRHDFLVNLLQTLVETLFFYHPAVWWLSKRIRIEREHCCDDLVIRVLQNRVEYGRALVAVEELRGQTSVLALGASDGSMLARIRRIVGAGPDRTDFELSGRWPVAFLAVVMLGFVLKIGVDSFASAVTEGELRDASEPVVVEQNDKADVDEPANLISSAGADGAVAELPDGRFVEIVGITRNTRPASEGWRPDGGGIGDVGYWKSTIVLHQQNTVATYNENGPHPDPDANALDFLLRFRGLKSQPSIRFELPANGGSHHHWPVKDPYEFRVSARLRGEVHPGATWNPPDGVVRVALTDEPWGKWLQISPRGEILNPHNEGDLYQADYDDARVERVEPHDRAPDGRVLVLRQPKNYADRYDFQIRGIDTDGKEQWVLRWDGDAVNGTNLEDSRWGLATTETKPLSRYEFRLRPYRHRVTFENVSLRAGQVTKVTWKAESTPSELQTQREHVPEIAERVRAADPAPVELLRLFEGDWQVERCDSALPLLGADRFLARKWRWTINGNEILWRREGETWKLKFTVDPGKSPGEIDLQFLSGPFEGKHVLGVFEWSRGDENRLTIAIQNPGATVDRPRNFENKPNGQTSLIVLRSDLPIDPASERAAFERSWVFANVVTRAWPKPTGLKNAQVNERRWKVQADQISWIGLDGNEVTMSFKLDPAQVPRQIDVTFLNGPFKGQTCLGVYEWAGPDGLEICLTDPGSNAKRAKQVFYAGDQPYSWITLEANAAVATAAAGSNSISADFSAKVDEEQTPRQGIEKLGASTSDLKSNSGKFATLETELSNLEDQYQQEVDNDGKQAKDAKRDKLAGVNDRDQKIQAKTDQIAGLKNRLNIARTELEQEKELREEERNDLTTKISQLNVRIEILKEKMETRAGQLEPFQGSWPMNLCDSEDRKLYAPQDVVKNWRWTVQGNKITWTRSKGEVWHLCFSVDPSKSPMEIDLTYLDGPFKGETCQGMYEWGGVDKNALLMSLQNPGAKVPRPKSISMTSGGQTSLLFLNPRETASSPSPEFLLPDHLNVMAIRFDRDSQNLVTISTESDVRIRKWNLAEKKLVSEIKLDSEKHGNYFLQGQLTLSDDCQRLAAMLGENVGIWDAATGKAVRTLVMPPELATSIPRSLSATPGLTRIASGTMSRYLGGIHSLDVNAVVWDASTGQAIQTVKHAGAVQLQSVALSADGQRLATGGQRAGACLWDVSTGKLLLTLPNLNSGRRHPDDAVSEEGANQVLCLRFSPDGKLLAMGDMLGVKLIDTQSGEVKFEFNAPFRMGRSGLVFSRDGQLLARTATDKVVPIWSTQTGKLLAEIPTEAHDASFSGDGNRFAAAFTDAENAVSVWRLERGLAAVPPPPGGVAEATGNRVDHPASSEPATPSPPGDANSRDAPNQDDNSEVGKVDSLPETIRFVVRDENPTDVHFDNPIKLSPPTTELLSSEEITLPFANVKSVKLELQGRRKGRMDVLFAFQGEIQPERRILVDLKGLDEQGKTLIHTWRVGSDFRADQTPNPPLGIKKVRGPNSSVWMQIPPQVLAELRTVELFFKPMSAADLKNVPDEPSKTNLRISLPDAEGRFSVFFDNPSDDSQQKRWVLDPEKHQVIFQVFVKTAEGKLQQKFFKQLTAAPQGGYRMDVQIPPDLFEYSTVSATFVTLQPDHETWVSNFFQKGIRTSYKGIWSSDGGLLLRTKLDGNLNGWQAAVKSEGLSAPTVKGRVMIDGPIPAVPPMKVRIGLNLVIPRNEADERRNEEREKNTPVTEIPDESLVISKEGGIANVAIYLKKAPASWKATDPPRDPVELRSADRRFSPHVSLLRVGQQLRLISPKTEADNFLIMPLRSNVINFLVPADSSRNVDSFFTVSEKYPAPVSSNLHGWQRAWLLGLDHPFAAITDSDGRFEIRDLPPGEHHFIVWHELRGPINKDLVVQVEPGKVAEVDLKFKAEQLKRDAPHSK